MPYTTWYEKNKLGEVGGGGGGEVEWPRKADLWQQSIQSYILHLLKALQQKPLSLALESQQIELCVYPTTGK